MKTMKKGEDIVRVDEKKQFDFLRRGYEYVAKKLWKDQVRDVNKVKNDEPKKSKNVENVDDKGKTSKKKSTKIISDVDSVKKPSKPKKSS